MFSKRKEDEKTRVENVRIIYSLDSKQYKRHKHRLKILGSQIPSRQVQGGDVVELRFDFSIEYLGGIHKRMEAALAILDEPGIITDVNYEELAHGEILIDKLLTTFREFKNKARENHQPKQED